MLCLLPIGYFFHNQNSINKPDFRIQPLSNDEKFDMQTSERLLSSTGDTHFSHSEMIIFWIFITVLFGAVLREIKKKTGIPYTPMVLVLGGIIGSFGDDNNSVNETTKWIIGIDPHAMLSIFIPALVFESAFNSDGFILNRSKWQIIMMAGPGVLVTTMIIAIVIRFVLGYSDDLTWAQALVIGSI